MKKRAKIITTIASLCLAVALMAFGVYAATTQTLSVTSKVSFEVTDVFVTLAGKVEIWDADYDNGDETTGAYVAADPTGDSAQASYSNVQTYTGTLGTNAVAKDTDPAAWDFGDVAYTSSDDAIKITISITNDATSGNVYVQVAGIQSVVAGTTVTSFYYTGSEKADAATTKALAAGNGVTALANSAAGIAIAPGATLQLVFTRVLNNKSANIDSANNFTNGTLSVNIAHDQQSAA